MSYTDFLEFIFTPITSFVNWLIMIANSLIHNYIFITFLGITIFISLFWLLFNTFYNYIDNKVRQYDDYNDKYNSFAEYQKIQREYYDKHRLEIFDFKYDKYALNQQIIISFFERNQDLLLDYKIKNLKLNKQSAYTYLTNNRDLESAIDYYNYQLKRQVASDYLLSYHDDELKYRLHNIDLNNQAKDLYKKNVVMKMQPSWLQNNINSTSLTKEEQDEIDDLVDNF